MCAVRVIYVVLLLVVVSPGVRAVGSTGELKEEHQHDRLRRGTVGGQSDRWCGLPGRDGRDGRDGIQGPYGPPGEKGEPGPPGYVTPVGFDEKMKEILASLTKQVSSALESHTQSQDKKVESLCEKESLRKPPSDSKTMTGRSSGDSTPKTEVPQTDASAGGAVYTRWGRTSCPDGTQRLYPGVVAGSHYEHQGSGANHLCLPLNPQWNRTVTGHQSQSYLYGAECEIIEANTGFRRENAGGKLQHDHEVQCAVCHTPGRLSHVMIPARLECPGGWTPEYIGFVMSAHHTHKRSEYVCMDQNPDVHPGTSPNKNGALFYVTEVVCGSLPCPPYAEGFEVTCVVCTK